MNNRSDKCSTALLCVALSICGFVIWSPMPKPKPVLCIEVLQYAGPPSTVGIGMNGVRVALHGGDALTLSKPYCWRIPRPEGGWGLQVSPSTAASRSIGSAARTVPENLLRACVAATSANFGFLAEHNPLLEIPAKVPQKLSTEGPSTTRGDRSDDV